MEDIVMEELLNSVDNDTSALRLVKSRRNRKTKPGIESMETQDQSGGAITKLFDVSDKYKLQRMINPKAQYKYAYVLLDTNNAAPELSSDTVFGWNVVNFISQQSGTVSTVNNIRDLVGMRIFPVTMQLITPVGETGKTYVNNIVNINNNFTILIHEFQAQSFVGREGRKFHFSLFPALMNPTTIFNPKLNATPIDPYYEFTTSGKGNGWFWFRTPITEFSTMTISIGNPFDLVRPNANNTRTLIPIQLVYLEERDAPF
jgi:hypothetical protein